MEVAMIFPTGRAVHFSILSIRTGFLSLLLLAGGCTQDVITYGGKSHHEGMRLYQEKAYVDAAGAFRNAVRQDPRDYHSHFYLAVCYDESSQHQQAFAQYRTALDVLKQARMEIADNDVYQMVLDSYASSVARFDQGEVELNNVEARAKNSQISEDWFILAKIYRLRGDADQAIDAYKRAARWDSSDYHPRKELGLYLLEPLKQNREAEYWLRQAYRLEPNDDALNAGLDRLGVVPFPAYKAKDPGPHTPAREMPQLRVGAPDPLERETIRTAGSPRD
jgi:tetratricopeptide (TPR) repeat protein